MELCLCLLITVRKKAVGEQNVLAEPFSGPKMIIMLFVLSAIAIAAYRQGRSRIKGTSYWFANGQCRFASTAFKPHKIRPTRPLTNYGGKNTSKQVRSLGFPKSVSLGILKFPKAERESPGVDTRNLLLASFYLCYLRSPVNDP